MGADAGGLTACPKSQHILGLCPLRNPRDCSWAFTALPCAVPCLGPPCMPPTAWWMPPHKRGRPCWEFRPRREWRAPKAFSCPGSEAPIWKQEGEPKWGWGRKNRPPEAEATREVSVLGRQDPSQATSPQRPPSRRCFLSSSGGPFWGVGPATPRVEPGHPQGTGGQRLGVRGGALGATVPQAALPPAGETRPPPRAE